MIRRIIGKIKDYRDNRSHSNSDFNFFEDVVNHIEEVKKRLEITWIK